MNDRSLEQLETRLSTIARALPYPPAPDVTAAVTRRLAAETRRRSGVPRRRLAWAAAALALLVLGLLAVPQVRAAVVDFLRLGAVRIFLGQPTPAPTLGALPGVAPSPPAPGATPLASLLDLAGETTLAEAGQQSGLPILLPAYPPDLGPPDRVYLQDLGGPLVVLVWLDPGRPRGVRLSLHLLGPGTFADKMQPQVVQETTVSGRPALWTEGPYILRLKNGDYDTRRLVGGNVLIWQDGETTYRLETDLSLEEGVRIAESLR